MSYLKSNLPARVKRSLLFGVTSILLAACSSGEDREARNQPPSSSDQSPSFIPDSERLLQEATNSKELYVEEGFRFDHTQLTRLTVSINNALGEALPFTRLSVYLVNSDAIGEAPEEWSDEYLAHAQLLTGGLSNQQGEFIRVVELLNTTKSNPLLLISVNAIGIDSKQLVKVESENTYVSFGLI